MEPKIDRQEIGITVIGPQARVFFERDRRKLENIDGQPFLLRLPPAFASCWSDGGITVHLPRKLAREVVHLLSEAEYEAEGELCWLQEQEHDAMMAEQDVEEEQDRGEDL